MLAESTRGVICTPHPAATRSGLAMLDAGGTSVEVRPEPLRREPVRT